MCVCVCDPCAGSGDTASELLVSMGSGTSLEDFYPSIAINSLMRILKDQSLSQHHTMAIQALGFIFKSLGIKSVPYLPQVNPNVLGSDYHSYYVIIKLVV